jgi:glycosyl transferase family 25
VSTPPIFVISLARAVDRRRRMADRLAGLPHELVEGVEGRDVLPDDPRVDHAAFERARGRPIRPGEVGCALAHRSIYQRMVDEGIEYACVLEDDAVPRADFGELLQATRAVPADLVLLMHAYGRSWLHQAVGRRYGRWRFVRPARFPFCTTAYTLNLRAARILLDATTPVRDLVDWPVGVDAFDVAAVVPRAVGVDLETPSLITERRYPRVPRAREQWLRGITGVAWRRGHWDSPVEYLKRRVLSVAISGEPRSDI